MPSHVIRTAAKPAFLALSCVGAFAGLPAWADDAAAPVANEDQSHTDVIVNGQRDAGPRDPKQVAPLINTPRSIVVLPSEVIEQTGSTSLQDALRTVPGITFGAAEGGNPIGDRPFIRGFDSQGSIYIDGVRDLASQSREVFAIDSVQIVRGSDSTLGGRGSAGGTINIMTKLPKAADFGSLSASFGNADYKRVAGDLNLKITDTIAFRLEGMWHDQDFAGRDAIWSRRWGVAPSVTIGLGTPTRLTASYYHMESHELPDSGIPYLYACSTNVCNAPTGNVFTTPAIGRITLADGTTGTVDRSAFYGLKDRDFRDTKTQTAMVRAEHDFGGITLRNTARYNYSQQSYIFLLPDDSNGNVFGLLNRATGAISPAPGTINPATGGSELTGGGYVWRRGNTRYGYSKALVDQIDLSGKFSTGAIEHSFAAGAEFSWEKTRRGAFVEATGSTITPRCDSTTLARYYCTSLFNPNPSDPWVNYASDTSNVRMPIVKGALNSETQNDASTVAVYGFDSITLLPSLILNLGARYDRYKSTITPPFTAGTTAARYSRTDELFNWQAGLVFKPTKDTSLYASYATSATPPNALLGEGSEPNALPTTAATANVLALLKPTKTKSYEVGAKANLFHERLGMSVAVFQTDIDNARVLDDSNTVAFIGKSRIRGVELSVSGQILPGWSVFGGYTYLDPKIIDGGTTALTAAAITQTVGGVATTIQNAKTVSVQSVNTGKQMPQTAKNSFTATSSYQITSRLSFGGTAIYMDKQYGGYADNRRATQNAAGVVTVTPATTVLSRGIPDYWRFDLNAQYKLTRNLQVSVNVQNLTDKVYFTQAYASHYATIAAGRTVFGTVTAKF
ncbi:TonB-dependent siderophore receptor [Sphingomonas sp. NFR15]|uniref:TonB-dependent receptor n=1 Tax=Sphingomonas sp. NFR15 TaxID=1566282 RepID=UPI000881CEC5|nr:TonB-dependent receptor [Sphingomonas sp. NFR15]SDA31007.1 catecholate siderophore receptor [Sphingomonas sp. NFR15]